MNTLHTSLGISFPLIQAPMAGAQGSTLALAVGAAGALGSLPGAMLPADPLRAELRKLHESGRSYNVNFFAHTSPPPDAARDAAWKEAVTPYYAEHGLDMSNIPAGPGRLPFSAEVAEVLEEFKPPIVSFHFGLPAPELLKRVKAWGAFVLSSATTVREALWLQENGADGVIAQGLEAGGHRGNFLSKDLSEQMGTFALLPQVVAAVRLPVIAAGGIANAASVRAAMALGASGVQAGTAYLFSDEATISPMHRAALQSEAARHTAITNLFTGRPARGIINRLMRELGPISSLAPEFPLATNAIAPLRAAAEKVGNTDFTSLWSGQNAGSCKSGSAAEITRELAKGFEPA